MTRDKTLVILASFVIFGISLLILIPQEASADITNFTFTPTTGNAPLSVFFKVTSTGTVNTVAWNFGDGSGTTTNTSLNATHVYQSAGNYTGTVEVTTSDHQTASESFRISITGATGANLGSVSSPNPDNNGAITAYQYLQQEHNGNSSVTTPVTITVATDRSSYNQGDSINISGKVSPLLPNQPVITIRIVNSLQNLVSISQVMLGSDGSFSKTALATGPLWTQAGTYTIIAEYGTIANNTKTFYLSGENGSSNPSSLPSNLPPPSYMLANSSASVGTSGNSQITVTTDKQSYVTNDTIVISGTADPNLTIKEYLAGIPTPIINKVAVAVRILNSAGNVISIHELNMSNNGMYTVQMQAQGALWGAPGLYTVIAQQGMNSQATAKFWFNYNGGPIPTSSPAQTPVPPQTLPPTVTPPHTNATMSTLGTTSASKIPAWVKNIFIWYGRGSISDDELIGAIQFLAQQGIIKVTPP